MSSYGYKATIKNLPPDERPREKLLAYGPRKLSNAELLAILLAKGSKEQSAISLAEAILSYNKEGMRFLTDCTVEELSSIKGIGLAKSSQLIAAVELGKRIALATKVNNYKIKSPEDVVDLLMEEMRYNKKEHFNILLLNTKNELIAEENISVGSLNASIVHPREVFIRAIKRSSSAIILVHNHPSGDPSPSSEDISITKRLIDAGDILGIKVLDHIIIGDGVFTSLKEKSLM
ncbi:RadC family protein [Alkaliphilus peptidifermentans]|uniref:DNA replication and repair protein RadC n=1 Tax=Alkaliphilus peptidifermentans DSM 18978 TaxID=1120976 RepID=A0A1G5DMA7_9FIRM|nr:DNA repair protein RadC [Alkaliphilus peptidifermentans]SCY15932.1 DNA replication and repair protein RadC [Alkaliphilus peptidifermentans DSM 18978]